MKKLILLCLFSANAIANEIEITGEIHRVGTTNYYACKAKNSAIRYSDKPCNYALLNDKDAFFNAPQSEIELVNTSFGGSNSTGDMTDRDEFGHELFTGPRGGCYYITFFGRKEYVDRAKCHIYD